MQKCCEQVQNPSVLINLLHSFPLEAFTLPFLLPQSISNSAEQHQSLVVFKQVLWKRTLNCQYRSWPKETIILRAKQPQEVMQLKTDKISDFQGQTTKIRRKCAQKESRNIVSNLLRIFLKNLIELRSYSRLIEKIASRLAVDFTPQHFYVWIQSFGINFKNYIRGSEVAKILSQQQPPHFTKAFLILLRLYSKQTGLTHCLTSKRIERNSIQMHLHGLRTLCRDLQSLSLPKI